MALSQDRLRLADQVRSRLSEPLPGLEAQMTMAPAGRISPDYTPTPRGARDASVLICVTEQEEIIFIRRADDGRAHSGQIAFPGGMAEDHDEDRIATALRETQEEIGMSPDAVQVLGALSPLYIPVTNFTVWPFVGLTGQPAEFVCQPAEVDEVIALPIAGFGGARAEMDWHYRDTTLRAPTYRFGAIDVWGATAMITAEFLQVWSEAVGFARRPGSG